MISPDLLQCIECSIPHKCAKSYDPSISCAQCVIHYSFIACEPVALECGHHICRQCKDKTQISSIICKTCNEYKRLSISTGKAAEFLIKTNLKDLTKVLFDKYSQTHSILKSLFHFILVFC